MIDDLHNILKETPTMFNMNGVDLKTKFNHCTVLIYYAGEGLKNPLHWAIILTVCILQSHVSA